MFLSRCSFRDDQRQVFPAPVSFGPAKGGKGGWRGEEAWWDASGPIAALSLGAYLRAPSLSPDPSRPLDPNIAGGQRPMVEPVYNIEDSSFEDDLISGQALRSVGHRPFFWGGFSDPGLSQCFPSKSYHLLVQFGLCRWVPTVLGSFQFGLVLALARTEPDSAMRAPAGRSPLKPFRLRGPETADGEPARRGALRCRPFPTRWLSENGRPFPGFKNRVASRSTPYSLRERHPWRGESGLISWPASSSRFRVLGRHASFLAFLACLHLNIMGH